ncbi:hypothetical protein [Leptolyngbya sp. GGD]|uniref:hypothetical protein n=1 Tax=Leptolyngbya sp. GGD TaxID=2997907 RepID=UPI00227B6B5B|nr:hypothetical protein [Leptolyngbya sp. GGD]MCY6492107.1 hypothetical protein [Leptolyngbya sp. GGD]
MNTIAVPRKKAGYYIDERIIEALKELAQRTGKSVNEYLEELLFIHCKIQGVIPPDAEILKDLRGGKRPGAGKPKKTESASSTEESDRLNSETNTED